MTSSGPVKILLASTGLNQAIAQTALALQESRLLASFMTTMVFPAGHGLLGKWPALASRQLHGVPPELIVRWPWFEFVRLLSGRADPTGVLTDRVWEIADKKFSAYVGRHLQNTQAVLGLEHASLEMFESAGRQGIARIYAVPSAHSGLIRELLVPELRQFPELRTAYVRQTASIEARRQVRRDAEFRTADIVLAHSSFTRGSYIGAGFDGGKVACVPFGAPPINQAIYQKTLQGEPSKDTRPPVFLFAGNFALHKGALTLWEAWRRARIPDARLLVAGRVHLPESVMRHSPPGVEYLGKLPWLELQRLYHQCTALVFPTLSDGFGMVVTEAMAQGLPVITTPNAGASDLITHGVNGLLTPIQDADALAAAMRNLADDPTLAHALRLSALETARHWQWSDFRLALVTVLQEKLRER